ncbi:uncharacterized protein L969DRAFT_36445, partial [Mixia osmundae IAM 14324]|uniref:uncharacterized protein n=1 Tax=Mixia osmundae (strain CBS 9802 / IAM 14324 / JCM 22182 / KY 12970) TaxID=764103 RepID=UPI0004A556A7
IFVSLCALARLSLAPTSTRFFCLRLHECRLVCDVLPTDSHPYTVQLETVADDYRSHFDLKPELGSRMYSNQVSPLSCFAYPDLISPSQFTWILVGLLEQPIRSTQGHFALAAVIKECCRVVQRNMFRTSLI